MANKKQLMKERAKAVLAMEYLARQINDEGVFERWLITGVADGDIEYGTTDPEMVDEYYTRDDNFRDLMTLFLKLMTAAWKSGGLYCGDITSAEKGDE